MPQVQPIRTRDGCWMSIEILPGGNPTITRWLYRLMPSTARQLGPNPRRILDHRPWTVRVELDRVDGAEPELLVLAADDRSDAEKVTAQLLERVRSGVAADDLLV